MGMIQEVAEFDYNEQRMLKHACTQDHLTFTRYFLKKREGIQFKLSPHHRIMASVLDKVYTGEIKRLIINVPPGYTKTEMAVVNFIAHGLAINPASKFIHLSYSDNLALYNSTLVRDVVTSEEYQALWPQELRSDSKSKKSWQNEYGGGMLAVASGGMVTGFRAGRMMDAFSGAIIMDDPIKPEDAYSQLIRDRINRRFTNTIKSRVAIESIPIIVIMQRIHEDDPSGFLLKGGTGDYWHHLVLPVDIMENPEPYNPEYIRGLQIIYSLPVGPLWPYKQNEIDIALLKESDPYTYASQYDQRPAPMGGGMFKGDWWKFYDVLPPVEWRIITGDTAQKTGQHNDWSVFQCWGYFQGSIYLIDQIRGKWEAPDLRMQLVAFWNKHNGSGTQTVGRLRAVYIEDKVSGTGLIQDIKRDKLLAIPIYGVPRVISKVQRANDFVHYIASGFVNLPRAAVWLSGYMAEFSKFTDRMTHTNDDQIDPTLDAIDIMLRPPKQFKGTYTTER